MRSPHAVTSLNPASNMRCARLPRLQRYEPLAWKTVTGKFPKLPLIVCSNQVPGDSKPSLQNNSQGSQKQKKFSDVEKTLAAKLGPTRGTWLQEIGKQNEINDKSSNCMYIKRNVRQFEEINFHGSIVILGDVSIGAKVQSGGDILVMGRLLGEAHAGAAGDRKAVILALSMEPSSVAIAEQRVVLSPSEGPSTAQPEVVRVSADGKIDIDVLSASRYNPKRTSAVEERILEHSRKHLPKVQWTLLEPELKSPAQFGGWKKASFVALFTGGYISVAGLLLMLFPVSIFGLLFDTSLISRGWIQVFGVLCLLFGLYYGGAAVGDLSGAGVSGFYLSTIVGRIILFLSFCVLVAMGAVQVSLLVLAILNLVGAVSMMAAMHSRNASQA